jgi:hypothetical protein
VIISMCSTSLTAVWTPLLATGFVTGFLAAAENACRKLFSTWQVPLLLLLVILNACTCKGLVNEMMCLLLLQVVSCGLLVRTRRVSVGWAHPSLTWHGCTGRPITRQCGGSMLTYTRYAAL